MNIIPHFQSHL